MLFTSYPGVFGIEHIIYMILVVILFALSFILIKKFIKTDKQKQLLIKIGAGVLLALIIANRISVTYYDVVINHREHYTWLNLIPNSWCGMSSLILSLALLFGKKDNPVLHCISYIGALGGFLTIIYPDFLDSQMFFEIRSVTGLLHHTMNLWLVIVSIMCQYLVPSIKKWYYYPLGLSLILSFGVFEKDALGFTKAMQINEPLLKSLPILTSWYVVGSVSIILQILVLLAFEHFRKNKSSN